MNRRPSNAISGNPVLVGAVTILVTIVAVFLSYNANKGLPFVPTQKVRFDSPTAAALLPGNEVLEGGKRIGIVERMRPVRRDDGKVVAEISLKLDASAGPLPADSTVAIRPRSPLGLKYVEFTRGRSTDELADGSRVGVAQARVPVQFDDLQSMYDGPTRRGMQQVILGSGGALAGRGLSLNRTLGELPPLLRDVEPLARMLADPGTDLRGFVRNLRAFVGALAPVTDAYGRGFTAGAQVFEAWSRDPESLARTVVEARRAVEQGRGDLRAQRPFLRDLRTLSAAVRDSAEVLPAALAPIDAALTRGVGVQRRLPEVNPEIARTLTSLRELTTDPNTPAALRGVDDTLDTLLPFTRFVGPYVTVCNYFNYGFGNALDAGSEPALGGSQRVLSNFPGERSPEGIAALGATQPGDGLHLNWLPAAIDRQGNADCESGQRGYVKRVARTGPADRNVVIDPATPGNQGPTYTGRARVPAGQTFSRRPELAPAFPAGADE